MSAPLKFQYAANAQKEFKPPLILNENAFLGDVFASTDTEKVMSAGFFRFEKGTPMVYTYTYHETKIVLEGEITVTDSTGQKVVGRPGDVFYFPKGSAVTFTTDSYALAFYTGQRANYPNDQFRPYPQ